MNNLPGPQFIIVVVYCRVSIAAFPPYSADVHNISNHNPESNCDLLQILLL